MARFFRESFDRTREFVVARPFKYDGELFAPSPYVIDKTLFSVRRLRQLFDFRNLEMAPVGAAPFSPDQGFEEIDTTPKPEPKGVVVDADTVYPVARRKTERLRPKSRLTRRRPLAQLSA